MIVQKGILKLTYYNIFLSKKEKVEKIENVKDIEIIQKGIVEPGIDTTKYYIKIIFYENNPFIFGESYHFLTIQEKYKECTAIIKETVIDDIFPIDNNEDD